MTTPRFDNLEGVRARIDEIRSRFGGRAAAPAGAFEAAVKHAASAVTETAAPTVPTAVGLGPYQQAIAEAAGRHGVDPALISAVIQQESGGNPRAVSPVGAQGLMQLMPSTAAGLGVKNPFDPAQNIAGGTKYLADMTRRFGLEEGLAAYNAGPGAVEKHGGVPPYPETQNYVKKVMSRYSALRSGAENQGVQP